MNKIKLLFFIGAILLSSSVFSDTHEKSVLGYRIGVDTKSELQSRLGATAKLYERGRVADEIQRTYKNLPVQEPFETPAQAAEFMIKAEPAAKIAPMLSIEDAGNISDANIDTLDLGFSPKNEDRLWSIIVAFSAKDSQVLEDIVSGITEKYPGGEFEDFTKIYMQPRYKVKDGDLYIRVSKIENKKCETAVVTSFLDSSPQECRSFKLEIIYQWTPFNSMVDQYWKEVSNADKNKKMSLVNQL